MTRSSAPDIRLLKADDLDPLWSIFREIIAEGATYVQDEETTEDGFREYWLGRGGEQWVAVLGDRVVGGYSLRRNQRGRGAHVANGSYIVDSAVRGNGVGLALGSHSLDRARALGFHAIQYNFVVSTNPAVNLWRKLGFEVVGTLPRAFFHKQLGYVDVFVMFRTLQ